MAEQTEENVKVAGQTEENVKVAGQAEENVKVAGQTEESPRVVEMAYCVRCKEKKEMVNPGVMVMKTNRRALQGKCIKCNTLMTRILPSKKA